MDVVYFLMEGNTARRLDSVMVKPMLDAGYHIMKMKVDGKNELEELEPGEEIQESRYGLVMVLQSPQEIQNEKIDAQQKEIEELKAELNKMKEAVK